MSFLVVIPVYNEVTTLLPVLKCLRRHYQGPILLVDDGSSDGSCAQQDLQNISDLQIITHEKNKGYGAALKTGFDYAIALKYQYAITMDCDEQHEPALIRKFMDFISAGTADIISGSRYLSQCLQVDTPPEDRVEINRVITAEINRMFSWHLTDGFCGYKAYTVDILKKLKITEFGYAMPLQLWVQLGKIGAQIEELAVPRIYKNLNRSFGGELDDPTKRLQYYRTVINEEFTKEESAKCHVTV